jgi:uncharacterized membrane protein
MDREKLLEYYKQHRGQINGAGIGLAAGILILLIGIFRTVFIVICVGLGWFIGKRYHEDKEYFKNLLDKILPPGTYR